MSKDSQSAGEKTTNGAVGEKARLILASSSPRRHEMIKYLRLPFEIIPSTYEEVIDCALAPAELVLTMAEEKAKDVFFRLHKAKPDENLIVLGADTMVILDGKFLGKPENEEDAFRMLKRLSGRKHEVYTGVVLVVSERMHGQPTIHRVTEVSEVFFRELADDEIQTYIKTKEPMDKAGSYALQGTGSALRREDQWMRYQYYRAADTESGVITEGYWHRGFGTDCALTLKLTKPRVPNIKPKAGVSPGY